MKSRVNDVDEVLQRDFEIAPGDEAKAAGARVWRRLQADGMSEFETRLERAQPAPSTRPYIGMAAAAAVLIAAIGTAILWPRTDQIDQYVTTDAAQLITLDDGSHVEMRAQSELTVEPADDGLRIRLDRGGIIVHAAEQRAGHLYVQTKDMTISVVGTVFLVNADEDGSRVAVIEGEVHVQQGAVETTLMRGDHLATNASVKALPVSEAIAWSRTAPARIAPLQQSAVVPPAVAPQNLPEPRVAFEVATIRPASGSAAPGARGGGGVSNMSPFAPGCAAAVPDIDPTRFALADTTIWNLITAAYSGNPFLFGCSDVTQLNVISGGPDWVRTEKWDVVARIPDGVLAAADLPREGHWLNEKPSTLQKMITTLLTDRLKLALRREMREVPAYALTMVDQGGPRFTPPPFEGAQLEEWKRRWDANMPSGQAIAEPGGHRGKDVYMRDLVAVLAGATGRPVLDGTGFTRPFSFYLPFRPIDNGNRFSGANNPRLAGLPSLFTALERQVGLKLEETRTDVEIWVIERIERPSEN